MDLLKQFVISWKLSRKVLHAQSAELLATMEGSAEFVPFVTSRDDFASKEVLIYHEKGIFQHEPQWPQLPSYRSYFYAFGKSCEETEEENVQVYHCKENSGYDISSKSDIGTLFYDVNFVQGVKEVAGSKHLCVKDCYEPRFFFLDKEAFRLEIKVTGPAKNYVIQSLYSRER